jgi:hypothetical protein
VTYSDISEEATEIKVTYSSVGIQDRYFFLLEKRAVYTFFPKSSGKLVTTLIGIIQVRF